MVKNYLFLSAKPALIVAGVQLMSDGTKMKDKDLDTILRIWAVILILFTATIGQRINSYITSLNASAFHKSK